MRIYRSVSNPQQSLSLSGETTTLMDKKKLHNNEQFSFSPKTKQIDISSKRDHITIVRTVNSIFALSFLTIQPSVVRFLVRTNIG